MSEKAKRITFFTYQALSTLLLIASGAALIAAAYGINSLGKNPYTYATVSAAFSSVAPLIFITLGILVLGTLTAPLFYPAPRRGGAHRMLSAQLRRVRAERTACGTDVSFEISRERRLRSVLLGATAVLFAVGVTLSLCYTLDGKNYSDALNASTLGAFLCTVINLAPAAVMLGISSFVCDTSLRREISAWQTLPKLEKTGACDEKTKKSVGIFGRLLENERALLIIRISLIALSAVLITLGIYNGGMRDVLEKAVKICTECIGLG
ncbi:MAG: hypothetical protein IKA64_05770 [Clostridia bacterium]|nr:hypothetical protein [Clostridia bacterium]